MDDQAFDLQVIISAGTATVGPALVGHGMAASAAAMGMRVLLFLANEGAEWGTDRIRRNAPTPDFQKIFDLQDSVNESAGRIEICSACGERLLREGVPLIAGIELGGLTSLASRAANTQTVSF